ncbi:MAG: glycoside hydrolase family 43 protein [Propionibacteriales bacterium]|nr:glycoside hydrolase family 43 protein [Propionibacteriales bacterium]
MRTAPGQIPSEVAPGALPGGLFVNPVGEGADPHVVDDGDRYLWCQSDGNVAVAIWVSDRLSSMGRKHVVWRAPAHGPYSREVWAPELHRFDHRWYIYMAASDGRNSNHRSYVLESSGDDPLGPYDVCGPLWTGDGKPDDDPNLWSIDVTVLEHDGRRYAIWSGWPTPTDDVQHLYIAEMAAPTKLVGPRVRLLEAGTQLWQRIEETPVSRGLLEAPQVLSRGDRTFVVYSCAASWLPTYKLGMLELTGGDPLDPDAWSHFDEPVFVANASTYGVGHGSFVRSLDRVEWWHVFHAKRDRRPGWQRALFVQPFGWDGEGAPVFGTPVSPGSPLALPAGTPRRLISDRRGWGFTSVDAIADFDYYGHHQFVDSATDGLHLGRVPTAPVNDYRSGEKVVLRDGAYADLAASATLTFVEGRRVAGLLFRTTAASVGYDAQRGYFTGIALDRQSLVLGKTDGREWTPLAEAALDVAAAAQHTIALRVVGDHIEVRSGPARLDMRDGDYRRGSVGLRVVDTHAVFTAFAVEPL